MYFFEKLIYLYKASVDTIQQFGLGYFLRFGSGQLRKQKLDIFKPSEDYDKILSKKPVDKKNVIDTLEIARIKYPGSQNSLDALCKRFNIDNSKREKHNALIDCHLLKEIYFNLLDQKELKLNLESSGVINSKFNSNARKNNNISRKIIKLSDDELELHKKYLQSQLPKNNYN